MVLKGNLDARIFEFGKDPYEISANSDLKFLK
jgi:dipeptidase E